MKKKPHYNSPPLTHKELVARNNAVIRMIKSWTPEEMMASLVRAGIYTKSGKLRKEYGGVAPRRSLAR